MFQNLTSTVGGTPRRRLPSSAGRAGLEQNMENYWDRVSSEKSCVLFIESHRATEDATTRGSMIHFLEDQSSHTLVDCVSSAARLLSCAHRVRMIPVISRPV